MSVTTITTTRKGLMSIRKITTTVYRVKCEKTGEEKDFTYLPKRCFVRSCSRYTCVTGDKRKGTFQRIRIEATK